MTLPDSTTEIYCQTCGNKWLRSDTTPQYYFASNDFSIGSMASPNKILGFTGLMGPFYPKIVAGLLVLDDEETGLGFAVENGLFTIDDDADVGEYNATIPDAPAPERFTLNSIGVMTFCPKCDTGRLARISEALGSGKTAEDLRIDPDGLDKERATSGGADVTHTGRNTRV